MLLNNFLEEIKENQPLFDLRISRYKSALDYYVNQYRLLILHITEDGAKSNYNINKRIRPFMFLIRHYFELLLKYNLDLNGVKYTNTHSFDKLYNQCYNTNIRLPSELKDAISVLNFDSDGGCFRYLKNIDGDIYFNDLLRIELHSLFQSYNNIPLTNSFKMDICNIANFTKPLIWEFTGCMNEIRTDAQLRSQYDDIIEFIIKGVLEKKIDINEIYLPFLFLIRHSLELGLKDNIKNILIIETQFEESNKILKRLCQEHSLARLYNIYQRYLSQLDLNILSEEHTRKYNLYKANYDSLNDTIHVLDNNSRQFRYPLEPTTKLPLTKISIFNIIQLYYNTDPFITFTIDVFKEYEIIPFSREELIQIYNYN